MARSSSSSGTHVVAMPQSSASGPVSRRERMTTSLVRAIPIMCSRRIEPPEPGIIPMRCSGRPTTAVSDTIRKSHARPSSKATPKQ